MNKYLYFNELDMIERFGAFYPFSETHGFYILIIFCGSSMRIEKSVCECSMFENIADGAKIEASVFEAAKEKALASLEIKI